MATTSVPSQSSGPIQLSDGSQNGVSVYNTDANALYVLVGAGTVSSSLFTVKLNTDDYWETHPNYAGEKIMGVWAADGAGVAMVADL